MSRTTIAAPTTSARQSGSPRRAEKIGFALACLFAAGVLLGTVYLLGGQSRGVPDFKMLYSAGLIARSYGLQRLYDPVLQQRLQLALPGLQSHPARGAAVLAAGRTPLPPRTAGVDSAVAGGAGCVFRRPAVYRPAPAFSLSLCLRRHRFCAADGGARRWPGHDFFATDPAGRPAVARARTRDRRGGRAGAGPVSLRGDAAASGDLRPATPVASGGSSRRRSRAGAAWLLGAGGHCRPARLCARAPHERAGARRLGRGPTALHAQPARAAGGAVGGPAAAAAAGGRDRAGFSCTAALGRTRVPRARSPGRPAPAASLFHRHHRRPARQLSPSSVRPYASDRRCLY